MAQTTSNLALKQPDMSDKVSETIPDLASNFGILDALMPVGYILMTTDVNFKPASSFPGTAWTQLHDVFLVASGAEFPGGSTGGASTHYHKLPIGFDGMTYYLYYSTEGNPKFGSEITIDKMGTWTIGEPKEGGQRVAWSDKASHVPPYKSVYMWERTA